MLRFSIVLHAFSLSSLFLTSILQEKQFEAKQTLLNFYIKARLA